MGPVFAVNFLEFVGESVPDGAINGDPHNDQQTPPRPRYHPPGRRHRHHRFVRRRRDPKVAIRCAQEPLARPGFVSPRDAQTMATMALVALDVGTDGTNSGTDETDLVLGPSPVTEKACPNAAIVARTGLKGLAALKAAGVVDPVLVRWHAKYSVHRGRARRRIPCSFGHFDQGRPPEAAKSGYTMTAERTNDPALNRQLCSS